VAGCARPALAQTESASLAVLAGQRHAATCRAVTAWRLARARPWRQGKAAGKAPAMTATARCARAPASRRSAQTSPCTTRTWAGGSRSRHQCGGATDRGGIGPSRKRGHGPRLATRTATPGHCSTSPRATTTGSPAARAPPAVSTICASPRRATTPRPASVHRTARGRSKRLCGTPNTLAWHTFRAARATRQPCCANPGRPPGTPPGGLRVAS
jgi:hypothetical protein